MNLRWVAQMLKETGKDFDLRDQNQWIWAYCEWLETKVQKGADAVMALRDVKAKLEGAEKL